MASVFLLNKVTPTGTEPLMVAVHDGNGVVRIAAEPGTYYADVVAPTWTARAKDATAEDAEQIIDTLTQRYSTDYRMDVSAGNGAGLTRKAEVLFRKWEAKG